MAQEPLSSLYPYSRLPPILRFPPVKLFHRVHREEDLYLRTRRRVFNTIEDV